jgi:hypothetical protein
MDNHGVGPDRRRLSQRLLDEWVMLRKDGALDGLLPRCGNAHWPRDDRPVGHVGYVTKDYRIRHRVEFPDPWHRKKTHCVDLVETYWSIRTAGGVQDVKWPPSLNAHAILVTDQTIATEHIDELYRSVLALTAAVSAGGFAGLARSGAKVSLYVRGVAIGSAVGDVGSVLGAIAEHADLPLSLASATYSPTGEIRIRESDQVERYFGGDFRPLQSHGHNLIGADELLRTGGFWTSDA